MANSPNEFRRIAEMRLLLSSDFHRRLFLETIFLVYYLFPLKEVDKQTRADGVRLPLSRTAFIP
jgi:hypothetical protein